MLLHLFVPLYTHPALWYLSWAAQFHPSVFSPEISKRHKMILVQLFHKTRYTREKCTASWQGSGRKFNSNEMSSPIVSEALHCNTKHVTNNAMRTIIWWEIHIIQSLLYFTKIKTYIMNWCLGNQDWKLSEQKEL